MELSPTRGLETQAREMQNGSTEPFYMKSGDFGDFRDLKTDYDQHRDRPRTRARQILDIFMGVAEIATSPVVTDFKRAA